MAAWKDVTDAEQVKEIAELLESALDGKQFSGCDDDTVLRAGIRYGTRHHMNDCTINPTLSKIKVQKRGSSLRTEYRIECPCIITAAYIRIEFGTWGSRKRDDTLKQNSDLEVVISAGGSSVKVLRTKTGSGSADGRKRMMRRAPGKLTLWINTALANE